VEADDTSVTGPSVDATKFLAELDAELERSVTRLKESAFFVRLVAGDSVRALYVAYLREAFHFVRLTSSFTPLAARRMDPKFIKLRRWILTHSAEELGHELRPRPICRRSASRRRRPRRPRRDPEPWPG
jgi:hypothetical protein